MQNVLFHFITEKVLYIRNTINKQTNHTTQTHNKNRVPFQYAQYEKSYNKQYHTNPLNVLYAN